MVELAGKPARKLERIHGACECLGIRGRFGDEIRCSLILPQLRSKLEGSTRIGELRARTVDRFDIPACGSKLRHKRTGTICVVPKAGGGAHLLELLHTPALLVDMQVRLDLRETLLQSAELVGRNVRDIGH